MSCCSSIFFENVKEIKFLKELRLTPDQDSKAVISAWRTACGMRVDSFCTALTQSNGNILQLLSSRKPPPSLDLEDVMRAECWRQTHHRREKVWLPVVTASFKAAVDYGSWSSAVFAFQVHLALQWGIIVTCFIALIHLEGNRKWWFEN